MNIGEKLKLLRQANNYSQSYVAKKLQVGRSTYSNYENNKTFMDSLVIEKVIKLYNIDAHFLFDTELTHRSASIHMLLNLERHLNGLEERERFWEFIMKQGTLYFDFLKLYKLK